MSKNESTKATFGQRLCAFIIDVFIVTMITSLIASPFVDIKTINKLKDSYEEVCEKYLNLEINTKTYIDEAMPLVYQTAREDGILSFVLIFFMILYYIVYPYYNKGKTIGKNLMKIKIVSKNGELTMNQLVVRALLINSILLELILFSLVIFSPVDIYFYGTIIFDLMQYLFIFISALMVMFSKQKRGLHDLISRCEVIREK